MSSKNEPAGVWIRVSSGGQEEENQVPDVEERCAARGYPIAKRYELSDKSASKGEQQAKLDEMLDDMRHGVIKVLVCWHADRLERRGPEYVFRLLAQARDAGGRIESIKEPLFGAQDISGEAMTALGAVIAHQYSVHLAEQVKIAHDRIKANGALGPGGIPWGYKKIGEKYNKKLVPDKAFIRTVNGKPKHYAVDIFERCIAGDSCRTIAIWLDSEDVKPVRGEQWNERSVWQIIHNMVYAGRRQNEGDIGPSGKPTRKNKITVMTCEAVISMDTYNQANAALRERPGRGPGVNGTLQPKSLLANLKCARCGSPMYRLRNYYRCFGRGTRRKGCGNMISLERLEIRTLFRILMRFDEPYTKKEWVEGVNYDAEIAHVMQDIRELPQKVDPLSPEFAFTQAELFAKLADYRSRETTKGELKKKNVLNGDGSVKTQGQHFFELGREDRREYLKTHDIRAEKSVNGPDGIRLIIDGEEDEPTPFELAFLNAVGPEIIRIMLASRDLNATEMLAFCAVKE